MCIVAFQLKFICEFGHKCYRDCEQRLKANPNKFCLIFGLSQSVSSGADRNFHLWWSQARVAKNFVKYLILECLNVYCLTAYLFIVCTSVKVRYMSQDVCL